MQFIPKILQPFPFFSSKFFLTFFLSLGLASSCYAAENQVRPLHFSTLHMVLPSKFEATLNAATTFYTTAGIYEQNPFDHNNTAVHFMLRLKPIPRPEIALRLIKLLSDSELHILARCVDSTGNTVLMAALQTLNYCFRKSQPVHDQIIEDLKSVVSALFSQSLVDATNIKYTTTPTGAQGIVQCISARQYFKDFLVKHPACESLIPLFEEQRVSTSEASSDARSISSSSSLDMKSLKAFLPSARPHTSNHDDQADVASIPATPVKKDLELVFTVPSLLDEGKSSSAPSTAIKPSYKEVAATPAQQPTTENKKRLSLPVPANPLSAAGRTITSSRFSKTPRKPAAQVAKKSETVLWPSDDEVAKQQRTTLQREIAKDLAAQKEVATQPKPQANQAPSREKPASKPVEQKSKPRSASEIKKSLHHNLTAADIELVIRDMQELQDLILAADSEIKPLKDSDVLAFLITHAEEVKDFFAIWIAGNVIHLDDALERKAKAAGLIEEPQAAATATTTHAPEPQKKRKTLAEVRAENAATRAAEAKKETVSLSKAIQKGITVSLGKDATQAIVEGLATADLKFLRTNDPFFQILPVRTAYPNPEPYFGSLVRACIVQNIVAVKYFIKKITNVSYTFHASEKYPTTLLHYIFETNLHQKMDSNFLCEMTKLIVKAPGFEPDKKIRGYTVLHIGASMPNTADALEVLLQPGMCNPGIFSSQGGTEYVPLSCIISYDSDGAITGADRAGMKKTIRLFLEDERSFHDILGIYLSLERLPDLQKKLLLEILSEPTPGRRHFFLRASDANQEHNIIPFLASNPSGHQTLMALLENPEIVPVEDLLKPRDKIALTGQAANPTALAILLTRWGITVRERKTRPESAAIIDVLIQELLERFAHLSNADLEEILPVSLNTILNLFNEMHSDINHLREQANQATT